MKYKILEVHIIYNHPHNNYILSVAIESSPGYWKAYFKQVNEISDKSIQDVAESGTKYRDYRARHLFENCRIEENLDRLKYE